VEVPREPVVTSVMREEATTPLTKSGWRRLRLPTAAMTAAAVVATSTAAAGWRGSGRGGRGVVEAVVQPLGWRGLPCRRRGGRRCGVAVGNTELAGGDSRCWWLQAATADGGRLVAMNVATVDVAVAEEVRMATAR
jgi:hypothetical protein